ncbi:MAG: hypothetical protein AB8B79_21880 [Granulosicoccus sp.]
MLTFLHIITGTLAVSSGLLGLFVSKGSVTHRIAGRVFTCAMILLGFTGIALALQVPMAISAVAGAAIIHLVITGSLAARSKPCAWQLIDTAAPVASLAIGLSSLVFAWEAWESANGLKDGFSAMPYGFFGALMLLVAALDLRYRLVADTTIVARRSRHVWRMSFALFIAAGSLFTGPGATAFPAWLQASGLLSVPEPLILLIMIYWLFRLRLTRKRSASEQQNIHLSNDESGKVS